jgi:hypothetical protein
MAPTIRVAIPPGNPKLLDTVRDVIRRKHYSFRTEQTYVDWIRRFILFHGKRCVERDARCVMRDAERKQSFQAKGVPKRNLGTRNDAGRAMRDR